MSLRILIISLFLLGCQSEAEMTPADIKLSEFPDQEGANATLTTTSNGKISSKITFGQMQGFSNQQLLKFSDGVEIRIYDESGEQVSRIVCQQATLNEISNDLQLNGAVQVYSEDGIYLETEQLRWDKSEDQILTEAFVTVVTAEKDTIYGDGFESEKSLANWTIKKPRGVSHKPVSGRE